tara:strand:- start:4973 stop:5368 length:396 start_codon:yes stop_codon:yes gene_type:complete
MKDHLILQKLIQNILKIDIFEPRRRREVVDARKIHASILYDRGQGVSRIGKLMRKNHATIIHYVNDHEILLLMDKQYKKNYETISNALDNKIYNDDLSLLSKEELIIEIIRYREENNKLRAKNLKIVKNKP